MERADRTHAVPQDNHPPRIITLHGCADMVSLDLPGELGVALRRDGRTVATDGDAVLVRELLPPAALPKPNINRSNTAAGDILCFFPLPHTKLDEK